MGDREEALLKKIEHAFCDVEYPGDDHLTDSTYGDEPAALIAEFRGKTDWRQLPAKFLDQAPDGWGSALAFFSDAALRFYLPAYLVADVRGELSMALPEARLSTTTGSRERPSLPDRAAWPPPLRWRGCAGCARAGARGWRRTGVR